MFSKYFCVRSRRALAGPRRRGCHTLRASGTVPSGPAPSLPCAGAIMKITHPGCPFPAVRRRGRVSTSSRAACFSLLQMHVRAPALCSRAQSNVSSIPLHVTFPPFPTEQLPPFLYPIKAGHGWLFEVQRLSLTAGKGSKR